MLRKIFIPIGYILLSAFLILATVALVFISRGYGYDFQHKRVIYNGLVVINSFPTGATVMVNGKVAKQKTPFRSSLESRDYDFEVFKAGYRAWRKRLNIPASGVTWAQYILLFPNDLKPQPISAVSGGVTSLFATRDHRHVGFLTAGTDPGLWVLSGDEKTATKVYTPKVVTPELPAETIDQPVYSEDGSHIMFHSTQADKSSYQVVSVSGGQPVNLTEQFGFNFTNLKFNPTNWRELFWVSPEGLRRLDVEAKTATLLVPGAVAGFTFAGDRLFSVTPTALGKSVISLDRSGHRQEVVQSLAESDSYQMLYSNFQGKDYLAVLPSKTGTVTLFSDIFSSNPVAKVVSKSANQISFNDDGRYLAFYTPNEFGSYDIEHDHLSGQVKLAGNLSYFGWFDNYHLLINSSGKLELTEYDGVNTVVLDEAAAPGSAAFGSADARRMLWLGQGKAKDEIVELDLKR